MAVSKEAGKKYVLAIDHGTSGVKTALMSCRGELAGFDFEKTPIRFLPGGGAEQDPDHWWKALVLTSQRLLARKLVPAEDVAAVCVSSTFSSTVAVGKDGRHLMPCLTWMDSRGAPYVKELIGGFPSFDGYGLKNILPWLYKTAGGPQLSGKDDIAHALFVKYERPDIYARTEAFLGSKDYLNLRLTGKIAASFDSMQLFWLTNTRDIHNMHYDPWLIRKAKLDAAKLPPLKRSIDVLGDLTPEAATALGLPPGVKVVMGSPDHQSACIGSGAVRDFEGHLYVGTSSWIQCIVPFRKTDILHSIASFPTAIPGKYYCVNEQDIAGGSLAWLIDNVLYPAGMPGRERPEDAFAILDKIAASVPPGSRKMIFTPWLNGERTPVDSTTIRGGFHNLSMTTSAREMTRAVLEGVAYNNRWALTYVEKFIGRRMDYLNMIGGGAKSSLWCQIFADVLDREVRQVKDPMQANARGATLIAAVALGCLEFSDIPELVPISATFKPDPGNRGIYDELFAEFLNIYKNNKAMYRRLSR